LGKKTYLYARAGGKDHSMHEMHQRQGIYFCVPS